MAITDFLTKAQSSPTVARRLPVGAEVQGKKGVHFRVWAPKRTAVEVVFEGSGGEPASLNAEGDGYFSALVPEVTAGTLYRYRLDGSEPVYPDPASRFQPDGPHGPSQVVDPSTFQWTDNAWKGAGAADHIMYEMHVGSFTREGTWAAAERELPELARLGITCLEIMPVADFAGRFGWGYDGVNMFAPTRLYGAPDDFRRFIDRAHAVGIAAILDVVFNHLGPDGNYVKAFADDYFTDHYKTDWGEALNFDGPNSGPVRQFYLANAQYWIEEFHLDGYRFDATQNIYDSSKDHILFEISRTARKAAGSRSIFLVNENEPQHVKIVEKPAEGGYGMDALWNDDFHHSAMVLLTGHNEAYYSDYLGRPQEFISVAKFGYLFQGQRYKWQHQRRGTPTFHLPATAFINFIENHDQLANQFGGWRSHHRSSPSHYRAMAALMMLMPGTPMLFQGQEFAASTPFNYFADHVPELAKLVQKGRGQFMAQFDSAATPSVQERLPDPAAVSTFEQSRLNLSERTAPGHAEAYAMYGDLIHLRKTTPAFAGRWPGGLDGAVLGHTALVLRFFSKDHDDRLLLVNFGADLHLDVAPEPLLAPPLDHTWHVVWSSEDPRYCGIGTAPMDSESNWRLPGHSAVVMAPKPAPPDHRDVKHYLEKQKVSGKK